MDNSLKVVTLSVAVVIVAIFLSSAFYLYKQGSNGANEMTAQFGSALRKGSGPDFEKYDGKVVDGRYVRESVAENAGKYFVRIRTAKVPTTFAVFSANESDGSMVIDTNSSGSFVFGNMKKSKNSYYIDATSKFHVTALYDVGNLCGVYFEQMSATSVTDSAKNSKMSEVQNAINSANTLSTKLSSLVSANDNLKEAIRNNKKESIIDRSAYTSYEAVVKTFNQQYKLYLNSCTEVEDAWKALEAAYEASDKEYGDAMGRRPINHESKEDDYDSGSIEFYQDMMDEE